MTNTPNDNEASEWGCLDLTNGNVITSKECRMYSENVTPIALPGSLGLFTEVPVMNATDLTPETSFPIYTETENTASRRDIIDYAEQQVPDNINLQPKTAGIDSVNVGGYQIIPPGNNEPETPFFKSSGFYFLIGIAVLIVGLVIYKMLKKK